MFDIEAETLRREIRKRRAGKVLIQLPEGLKREGLRIAHLIEDEGALPIISADPCYGACDLASSEANSLSVDLIVHYGHSQIIRNAPAPVIYIEARAKVNVRETVKASLQIMKHWNVIGLVTTVQHIKMLDEAESILRRAGKETRIGDAGNLKYPGQVIGCDYSNAKCIEDDVDAFLFIGGGRFHPLGLAINTKKPVVAADPYRRTAYPLIEDAQKLIRKRWACICKAEQASIFGVIIGLKDGQRNMDAAIKIKDLLIENGKRAFLLAMREIKNDLLIQFPQIEAYVNTACPRVSFDEFAKPVLTVKEALVMLKKIRWENLIDEGWFSKESRIQ